MSPTRWVELTAAIGVFTKNGAGGGTFAQCDIAFKFANWVSVEFELYLVMEFQRLKAKEQELIEWTAKRELSKINYRIHTDAIKSHLIPKKVTPTQANIIYAEEADVLNVAMFGMTARQWRESNPDLKGNIRDYASVNELICLSNMENINAVLINDDIPQGERLVRLNQIAIHQMQILERNSNRNLLRWFLFVNKTIENNTHSLVHKEDRYNSLWGVVIIRKSLYVETIKGWILSVLLLPCLLYSLSSFRKHLDYLSTS